MRISTFFFIVLLITLFGACVSGDVKKPPTAPDNTAYNFTLPDQNGKLITLSNVLKKYHGAVIAFYPKDDTKK